MRFIVIFFSIALIAGCQGYPKKPAECKGDFRPVNLSGGASARLSHAESAALCEGIGVNHG